MKTIKQTLFSILMMVSLAILISCSDDDDETPIELSIQDFNITIPENPSDDGLFIGTLEASTNRGTISFGLTEPDPTGAIQVNPETGDLTIISPSLFDFETRERVTAKAVVIVENVTDTASVTITITDVDETVLSAEDFSVEINENPENGELIGAIAAATSSGPIIFELTTEEPAGAIEVNASTGQITVLDSSFFDHEVRTSITGAVTLTDAADDIAIASITINILDIAVEELTVSDFAVTIDENPTNGEVLGVINAASPAGEDFSFSITSQSAVGAIAIGASNGELTVADASLFEFDINPKLTAEVEVTDAVGAVASLTATVTLLEGNDPSFITTWTLTDNLTLSFPESATAVADFGVAYDYTIDWGDGTILDYGDVEDGSMAEHTYTAAGTYIIKISGAYPYADFSYTDADDALIDNNEIVSVDAWGENTWYSFANTFRKCVNLQINASDAPIIAPRSSFPDGSTVAGMSMSAMFQEALNFNSNNSIATWDVSEVVNMSGMFRVLNVFNEDISGWDTDNVTDASGMFFGNTAFNQPIGGWFQAGNLTATQNMFNSNTIFNQDISGWNMSNVLTMQFMFQEAPLFNQDISSWNTGSVTDMRSVFRGAAAFNQDLGAWDVTAVGTAGSANRMNNIFSDSGDGTLICGISPENYSACMNGWATQAVQTNIRLDAIGRTYCDGSGRSTLEVTFGWRITDEGQDPACN